MPWEALTPPLFSNSPNDQVVRFGYLCRRAARKFWRAGLERCDLEQVAAIGLIKASRRYDPATLTPFEAYAWMMIVGELMVDVDDFKRINDNHGHAHGDTVLKIVATTLTRSSRAQDVVGRFAGDEFVALLVDVDADTARTLVARISADFRAAGLRCSLGAALYPQDGRDANALFGAADRALYATKAAGKNGYSFA